MSEIAQENEQALIIQKSLEIFAEAPQILQNNQIRKDKAIEVGQNILGAIEQNGMNEDLDKRCQTYLANINQAAKEFKENRTGVTQIMDQLKKMYTEVENEIDIKKPDTIPGKIQLHRNAYVKQVAEEKERKRQELENERRKKEEAIEISSSINSFIAQELINSLAAKKQKMTNTFNNISLVDFDIKSSSLKGMDTGIGIPELQSLVLVGKFAVKYIYHNLEETMSIQSDCFEQYDWNAAALKWKEEIDAIKIDLIDKLPSKLNELQEAKRLADEAAAAAEKARKEEEERQAAIAQANAAEKARLEEESRLAKIEEEKRLALLKEQQEQQEKERQEREAAEKLRIEEEAKAAAELAKQEAEIKRQGDITMNMFEQEAELAVLTETPEARQGYEIKVSHPVGYTQIFAFWFEKEGKGLPMDKIEKTSVAQMKAWCEKYAHKSDEKLQSQFLTYEPTYKAVNRKQD